MRALFLVVAGLAALYAGYWFVGEARVERGAVQALADLEARGWEVGYGSLNTTGFPSRFDTTVRDLRLGDPRGLVVWEAPVVQAFALSYRPNRVIVAFPPEQLFALGSPGLPAGFGGSEVTLSSDRLRASGAVGSGSALEAVTVEGDGLALHDNLGGQGAAAERLLVALRRSGPSEGSYDLFLEAQGLVAGLMGGPAHLRLDAAVLLDRPLDGTLESPPALLALDVRGASAAAGAGSLSVAGRLAPGAGGALEGTLDLSARGWAEVLGAARDAGLLDEGAAILLGRLLDEAAGGAEAVEVPLTFEGGRITVLGLPIGAAPVVDAP